MRKRTLFSPGAFLSKKWPIYFHKNLKERRGKIVGFSYIIPLIIFKGFCLVGWLVGVFFIFLSTG